MSTDRYTEALKMLASAAAIITKWRVSGDVEFKNVDMSSMLWLGDYKGMLPYLTTTPTEPHVEAVARLIAAAPPTPPDERFICSTSTATYGAEPPRVPEDEIERQIRLAVLGCVGPAVSATQIAAVAARAAIRAINAASRGTP